MKKNYYLLTAIAVFTACTTAIPEEPGNDSVKVTYIRALGEENSKASIDNTTAQFTWNTGDKIAIFADGGYKVSDALPIDYNNTNDATFSFSGSEAFAESGRANFALFPEKLAYDSSNNIYTSGVTASSLKVNLPASYNLSEVKDDLSPTPMIATNAPDGTLAFKSICALLRFTLVNVPKQTLYITFDFNDKKVQGEFTLTGVDLDNLTSFAGAQTTSTSGSDDIITVCNDGVFSAFQTGLVVNVPVPAGAASTGEYTDVTITTWDGEPGNGGHKINSYKAPVTTTVDPSDAKKYKSWVPGRKSSRKRTVYLPVFTVDGTWNSLGTGTKVVIAPGNLQADIETYPKYSSPIGTATNWRFATHQYDALSVNGSSDGNIFKSSSNTALDLFGWIGSGAENEYDVNQKYGVIYYSFSGATPNNNAYWVGSNTSDTIMSDWGSLSISDEVGIYPAGTWRLPRKNSDNTSEWNRLLTNRKVGSNAKDYIRAKATLKDGESIIARGLIIFPDQYAGNDPQNLVAPVNMPVIKNNPAANNNADYASNILSLEDWEKLESVGCVFLPAAGYRDKQNNAPAVLNEGYEGGYWTNYYSGSSASSSAIAVIFGDHTLLTSYDVSTTSNLIGSTTSDLNSAKGISRLRGLSVRLIRDVN